jgi:hypothetical protein
MVVEKGMEDGVPDEGHITYVDKIGKQNTNLG